LRAPCRAATHDGFAAQLLRLDGTRVFPAMMSFKSLLIVGVGESS